MNSPLVVEIPHQLGKEEAIQRLKAGIGKASAQYGNIVQVQEEIWSGDRLSFRVGAMKQTISGNLEVRDQNVRVEVVLPWLLARLASGIQAAIRKSGTLLLDKK